MNLRLPKNTKLMRQFQAQILAAREPNKLFGVGNGLCWIESEEQRNLEGQREIIDVLIFVIDFEDNRKIKIARGITVYLV